MPKPRKVVQLCGTDRDCAASGQRLRLLKAIGVNCGVMTKADLHRLIDDLPDEAVEGASVLIQRVLLREIDPSQAWVWTPAWQEQLRQSLSDLASGKTRRYESSEAFLDSLT
jgi:hypothetical protein